MHRDVRALADVDRAGYRSLICPVSDVDVMCRAVAVLVLRSVRPVGSKRRDGGRT